MACFINLDIRIMAKILITGGSGLVGTKLSYLLSERGHEVSHLSRRVTGKEHFPTFKWDVERETLDTDALQGIDYLIHLAGAGVADKKWTDARKKLILESRTRSTKLLYDQVKASQTQLKGYVSASAIGLYGSDTGDKLMDEDSPAGTDFLAHVVRDWEAAADLFQEITQVSKVRIGIVLSSEGGALPEIMRPVKYFVGAPLGSGKQLMSWIDIDDLCEIFAFVIDQNLAGTFNAVAPNPVNNAEFTRQLATIMKKPLLLPPVPAFVMRLLLGEMSQIVLGGNRVSSQFIQQKGFKFRFTHLKDSLQNQLQ